MIERNGDTDSFTLGTPAQGGCTKVYFNADNLKETQRKIAKAMVLHKLFVEDKPLLTPEKLKQIIEGV